MFGKTKRRGQLSKKVFKQTLRYWKRYGADFALRGLALVLGAGLVTGYFAVFGAFSSLPTLATAGPTLTNFFSNTSNTTYKDAATTTGVWHTGGNFGELARNLTAGWISNSTLESVDGVSVPITQNLAISPTFSWSADCSADKDACTIFAGGRGVWRSQDRGSSWTNISNNTGASDLPATIYQYIVVSPTYATDHAVFVTAQGLGIYRSSDADVASPAWALVDCSAAAGCTNAGVSTFSVANDYDDDTGACGATNCLILFGTSSSGVYRTADKGATWAAFGSANTAHAGTDNVAQIIASPNFALDSVLYILWDDEVLIQSTNGGVAWVTVTGLPATPDVRHIALTPDHNGDTPAGAIYVTYDNNGTATDVYKSTALNTLDSAPAWATEDVITGANIFKGHRIVFHPSYTEGGATQTLFLSTGLTGTGLYRSDNAGAAWTSIVGTSPDNVNSVGALAVAPNLFSGNPVVIAGSTGDSVNRSGIFITTNGSASPPVWTRRTTGLQSLLFSDIVFSPNYSTDGTYFVADKQNGVFKTTDRGANFTRLASGLNLGGTLNGTRALAISPDYNESTASATCSSGTPSDTSKCTLFFADDRGIYRSIDKGATWSAITTGLAVDHMAVTTIAVSPALATDQTVFIGTEENQPVKSGRVFRSADALGAAPSWTSVHTSNTTVTALAVSPSYATDKAVFASLESTGVLKSTNANVASPTWTTLTFTTSPYNVVVSPTFDDDAASCAAADVCTAFVMEKTSGKVWRTQNLGNADGDWSNTVTVAGIGTPYGMAISPNYAADTKLLVAGSQGIAGSADAGASFTADNTGALSSVFGGTASDVRIALSAAFSPFYATDTLAWVGSFVSGFTNRFDSTLGTLQSSKLSSATGESVVQSAILNAGSSVDNGQTIVYQLTNDAGTTWNAVTSGTPYAFSTSGTDLRWRAVLSTADATVTPRVANDLSVTYNTAGSSGGTPPPPPPPPPPVPTLKAPTWLDDHPCFGVSPTEVKCTLVDRAEDPEEKGFKLLCGDGTREEVVAAAQSGKDTEFTTSEISTGRGANTPLDDTCAIVAYDDDGVSEPTDLPPTYSLANKPGAPTVTQTSSFAAKIIISQNGNPAGATSYAITDADRGGWLTPDGEFSSEQKVWKTYAEWGGDAGQAINNLQKGVTYHFSVQARNGDNVENPDIAETPFSLQAAGTTLFLTKKLAPKIVLPILQGRPEDGPLSAVGGSLGTISQASGGFALLFLALFMMAGKGVVGAQGQVSLRRVYRGMLSKDTYTLFRACAKRGECGTYDTSLSFIKKQHRLAHRSVLLAFGLALVKAAFAASVIFFGPAAETPVLAQSEIVYKPGETAEYIFSIENRGGATAENTEFTDTMDSRLEFVPGSIFPSDVNAYGYSDLDKKLVIHLGSLDAKGGQASSRAFSFRVKIKNNAQGLITNTARVVADNATAVDSVCPTGADCNILVQGGDSIVPAPVPAPVPVPEPVPAPVPVPKPIPIPVPAPVPAPVPGPVGGGGGGGGTAPVVSIEIPKTDITYISVSGDALTNNPTPSVVGRASYLGGRPIPVGALVEIRANESTLGVAAVDENGRFVWRPSQRLEDGAYAFAASSDGTLSSPVKITVDTVIRTPLVRAANFHTDARAEAPASAGDTKSTAPLIPTRIEMSGATDPDTEYLELRVVPSRGATSSVPFRLFLPARAAGAPITERFAPRGAGWSYSAVVPLESGDYQASVTAKDFAGNFSLASPPVNFSVRLPQCMDGFDNDKDGATDYPADVECPSALGESESPRLAELIFNNPDVKRVTERYATPALATIILLNFGWAINWSALLNLLQSLITQPIMLLERRRRKGWGVVYNALSKLPVDLATVRLFTAEGRLLQTRVTDKQGRYAFIVGPGFYRIEVNKAGFVYPSVILKDKKEDLDFLDLYHREVIEVKEESTTIAANIPLDPVEKAETPKDVMRRAAFRKIQRRTAVVGPILSVVGVILAPSWITAIPMAAHIGLYIVFLRLSRTRRPKSWGIVYERAAGAPIQFAIARVFENQYNKLLETQVTDAKGRYSFLVGRNVYYLVFDKPGYESYKTAPVDLTKREKEAFLGMDVRLVKKADLPTNTPPPPPEPAESTEISNPSQPSTPSSGNPSQPKLP